MFIYRLYTDEDLKWHTPLSGAFHSIHLSVTVALESLAGRLQASHYKYSRVYIYLLSTETSLVYVRYIVNPYFAIKYNCRIIQSSDEAECPS